MQHAPTVEWANALIDELGDMPQIDTDQIVLRQATDVGHLRLDGSGAATAAIYYPALAVPLGEEDELVCPSRHVDIARARLGRTDGLNLLVIGYSGVDLEVLGLLKESGNSIRRMLVANGSPERAREAAEKIATALGANTLRDEWVTDLGFTELVAQGALSRWFADLT